MFVAVSNRCFSDRSLIESLTRLSELGYAASEIAVGDRPSDVRPEWITQDFDQTVRLCLYCRPITPVSLFFDLEPSAPDYFARFDDCCRLAKAIKVVVITVRSAIPGTPYNEEIERLRRINAVGLREGILIGLLTERGRIADLPESIESLCKSVPQLAVTLDPSQFIYGREKLISYDLILPRVCHLRLRDTTSDAFQVQIGQGVLEYNKLMNGLIQTRYKGALCVDLAPLSDIDPESELRKMRLFLESLL